MRTFRQEKQTINAGMQRFLYSRAVGKDEVASSNLASSSIVEAKSALLRRFFYAKIAIRPLPCFSSPTQTHFVGLCVGISVKRILSRIRLFCVYFVLKFSRCFSPTHPPTHGRSSFHYLIMENRKKARANLSPTFFVLLLFSILRSFLDDLLLYIVRFVHYLVPVWNVHCFVHPEAHLVHHFKIRCSRALIRVCPDPSPRQIG